MILSMFQTARPSHPRRDRQTRHTLVLEGLESRTVLSQLAAMPTTAAHVAGVAHHAERLQITSFHVSGVTLQNNHLVANATISGTVKNFPFTKSVAIPLTLTAAPAATTGTAKPAATTAAAPAVSVLHLTLGPVNLSLLGLNVHLGGDCSFTSTKPITADVVAIPTGSTYHSPITGQNYTGGLLGDVLSGVANLLNGGGTLSGLTGSKLSSLESGLTNLLNQILAPASGATGGTIGGTKAVTPVAGSGKTSEVLELPLGPVTIDLLGAGADQPDLPERHRNQRRRQPAG